jgi:hypothetical protein
MGDDDPLRSHAIAAVSVTNIIFGSAIIRFNLSAWW